MLCARYLTRKIIDNSVGYQEKGDGRGKNVNRSDERLCLNWGIVFLEKDRILENNAFFSRNSAHKLSDVSSKMNVFGLCSFPVLPVTVRYMRMCNDIDHA